MEWLLEMAANWASTHLAHQVKVGVSPLAPYLRRLASGVLMIVVSAGLWLLGLLFFLFGLFLEVGGNVQYAPAAFWTGSVALLLGLLLTILGFSFIKKPRP